MPDKNKNNLDELQNLEPGSVMVIGDELTLYQCAEEYDKRVRKQTS